ncbi:MAG TPA: GNAT family N-acetyltransferase [Kiloniellales bacterium]|nr:GNAT family N-acetyltransferase [Kiloniellales bacterium]
MQGAKALSIVPPEEQHREEWERLYSGYAAFYKVQQTPEMRARVWGWIQNRDHEVEGLIALNPQGEAIGLSHFRPYSRPLMATTACFLDDLFVDPQARGSGAADALIEAVARIARERGWSLLRWITAENNYRARGLYDRLAARTDWVTYDMKL